MENFEYYNPVKLIFMAIYLNEYTLIYRMNRLNMLTILRQRQIRKSVRQSAEYR